MRLLRAKPREAAPAAAGAVAAPPPRSLKHRLRAPRGAMGRWPRWAAGILAAVIVVEVGALGYQLLRSLPVRTSPSSEPAPDAPPEPVPQPLPLPSLAAVSARPIFVEPIGTGEGGVGGRAAQAPSGLARQLAARLNLLGIVAGDAPQAIIEDAQTQKTYFVTTGQTVVEGAVLREIRDTRVILDLGGEPIELTL